MENGGRTIFLLWFLLVKLHHSFNIRVDRVVWRRKLCTESYTEESKVSKPHYFFSEGERDRGLRTLNKGNNTASLLELIRLGDRWLAGSPLSTVNINELEGEYLSVFGCLANVKVAAITEPSTQLVIVTGLADSKVALGMLAYIAQILKAMTVEEVLRLDAEHLAKDVGIDQFLPVGRLNGFINIIKTVQRSLSAKDSLRLADLRVSSPPSLSIDSNSDLDPRKEEVAVLLSGGVDSSVVLALLLQRGYKVRAYYLKIWLEDEIAHLNECPWEEDLSYASAVCSQLNVPLEVISLQKEYWEFVVDYTLKEAKAGRTPNPDIMCNSFIKFGAFHQYVGKFHAKIASGHYARLLPSPWTESSASQLPQRLAVMGFSVNSNVRSFLGKSPDLIKDQSYFLSNLRPEQMERCLFPIDSYLKEEVRRLAKDFNLPTQSRKDSQGICFLGKLKFEDFLRHYLGESEGEIVYYNPQAGNETATASPTAPSVSSLRHNQVIGRHHGLWFHTIGQRKGVGNLLQPTVLHHGPFYVVKKNLEQNQIYVTNHWEIIEKPRKICYLENINWLIGEPQWIGDSMVLEREEASHLSSTHQTVFRRSPDFFVHVKLRHGPSLLPARISWVLVSPPKADKKISAKVEGIRIELIEKDKGIAPGQFAVIYLEDYCIAAGTIQQTALD